MTAARLVLVEALKAVGLKLEPTDESAGKVMQEMRKRGFRMKKMGSSERLVYANKKQRGD